MKTIIDFIKENNIVIDNKYFKLFWKTIINKNKWIYLSDKMINGDMGYKKISDFYKDTLRKKYKENHEFKEIDKNHDLVNANEESSALRKVPHKRGVAKKYYAVTSKTLKMLFLQCRTTNGLSLCNYYIDLELIFISYMHYQCEYHKLNINDELEILSESSNISEYSNAIRKQEFYRKLKDIYRIGYVYYIQEEQTKNIKIGYSFNLKERLAELQVANSQKLTVVKYEKCIFPQIREKELHNKYKSYHLRGEWFSNML